MRRHRALCLNELLLQACDLARPAVGSSDAATDASRRAADRPELDVTGAHAKAERLGGLSGVVDRRRGGDDQSHAAASAQARLQQRRQLRVAVGDVLLRGPTAGRSYRGLSRAIA